MYGNMSEDLGAHRQQQRHSPTRWDEDQFAGERDLEVGEAARVEVFEDAVAVLRAVKAILRWSLRN